MFTRRAQNLPRAASRNRGKPGGTAPGVESDSHTVLTVVLSLWIASEKALPKNGGTGHRAFRCCPNARS